MKLSTSLNNLVWLDAPAAGLFRSGVLAFGLMLTIVR
jgi:hypothetical protein